MVIFLITWILTGILGFTIMTLTRYERGQEIPITLLDIFGFITFIIGGYIMFAIALILLFKKWLNSDYLGYFEEVLFFIDKDKD